MNYSDSTKDHVCMYYPHVQRFLKQGHSLEDSVALGIGSRSIQSKGTDKVIKKYIAEYEEITKVFNERPSYEANFTKSVFNENGEKIRVKDTVIIHGYTKDGIAKSFALETCRMHEVEQVSFKLNKQN